MSGQLTAPPRNMTVLVFSPVFGLMNVPPCPHDGCGWFMPDLSCPVHGNYGMTYLDVRQGPITWVKAVLGIPHEPLPDDPARPQDAGGGRRRAIQGPQGSDGGR